MENEVSIWFTIVSGASNTTRKTIRANWSWASVPLIAKTDVFAVRWAGVDHQSHYIDMVSPAGSSYRYASVNYVNDYGPAYTKNLSITPDDGFCSLRVSFKEGDSYNGDLVFAKSGSLTFTLKLLDSTNSINYIKVGEYMVTTHTHFQQVLMSAIQEKLV